MPQPAYFAIPGDLSLPTGGYGYDRKVLAHAEAAGLELHHLALPGGYPFPDEAVLNESARRMAATPAGSVLMIDGLAYGAMPAAMIAALDRPVVELCHHPLALEAGLDAASAARLGASERAAMALARHVIVTGQATAEVVARDFGVARERITVALPGTERAMRAAGSGDGPIRMIAVGSVIPRKGYDVLVQALAGLGDLGWSLDIAGATTLSPETTATVSKLIDAHGLSARVRLLGALDEQGLNRLYHHADLFVLASHYEGYGMALAEAMARGLAIVTTSCGPAAAAMPPQAGIQVPVAAPEALAEAIRTMLTSVEKRRTFSDGAWTAGRQLPDWASTARTIAAVLKEVAR